MLKTPDLSFFGLEEFVNEHIVSEPIVKKHVVETSEAKASADKPKVVRKNFGPPLIEDWISDSEDEAESKSKIEKKTVKPSFAKIEFVKSKKQVKSPRKTTDEQGDQNRLNTLSPTRNQRNWNYMMSQRLGSNFEMINKLAYSCVKVLLHLQPKAVVNAARPKAVVNVVKGNNVNVVKASAYWVWKPKTKVLDHGNPQQDLQEKGVIDSGCSRHMTGNMKLVYGNEFKEFSDDGSPITSSDDEKKVDEDPRKDSESINQEKDDNINSTNNVNVTSTNEVNVIGGKTSIELLDDPNMPVLEDIVYSDDDEDDGAEADMNNLDKTIQVSPIPTTRIHKDHPLNQQSLDRKSITRGCQFLGSRLISWQCKKQTVVANSTIEAEYVADSSCCGQLMLLGINLLLLLEVNAARHNLLLLLEVNAARHNLLLLLKVNAARHKFTTAGEPQITTLKFADTYNMVACLAKPAECEGFEQIVDFLNAHTIEYALTVNPTIYTLCIKQFWATVKAKTVHGEVQLQALLDGKKIIITESIVRRDLQLEDAEGVDCLSNATIFKQLALIGYEKLSQKLTFYKAFFSLQ
ncbi:hypothetical protein Tco_1450067 [Tanacetum coccineum]